LNEELVKEQYYLCAYCCGRIDTKKSHNEHIEPRNPKHGVSHKSLNYDNLVASCYGFQGEKTCGCKKQNDYDEKKFVSPLMPSCEDVFDYYPNGEIEGDTYTINLLNLDSYKLRKAREAVYNTIMSMDEESIRLAYLNEEDEMLQPFVNVIKWYLRQVEKN
jgi:uncharacterized protein (TIGR02646 family)